MSATSDKRDRADENQAARGDRVDDWRQARNEGVREGLLMAMEAIKTTVADGLAKGGTVELDVMDVIRQRGNRHFGNTDWQDASGCAVGARG